jgi:hypothetical protein
MAEQKETKGRDRKRTSTSFKAGKNRNASRQSSEAGSENKSESKTVRERCEKRFWFVPISWQRTYMLIIMQALTAVVETIERLMEKLGLPEVQS